MKTSEPLPILFMREKGQPPLWLREVTSEETARYWSERLKYEALILGRKPATLGEPPQAVDTKA